VLRFVKQIIKGLLASVGLIIFKRSTGIYIGEDETPSLAVRLGGTVRPVVIDGGAHKGGFVDAIRKIAPDAHFLCFEPDPTLATALRLKYADNPNVRIVQAALGAAPEKASFHINQSRACNSLAVSGDGATGVLGDLMMTVETIDVNVTTIDAAMTDAGIPACDILKLDLQSHDLQALLGAGQTLRSAKVVVVEVWYAPVYSGTVTYLQIFDLLVKRGFVLHSLLGLHYSTTDRLLWSDAVFLRADSPQAAEPATIV
jgi:FkbM family methyltransferase